MILKKAEEPKGIRVKGQKGCHAIVMQLFRSMNKDFGKR